VLRPRTCYGVVFDVAPRVRWRAKVTHDVFGQLQARLLGDVVKEHLRPLPSRGHASKSQRQRTRRRMTRRQA
jgi:hypothetical protein